jgi:hypothetical protein
MTGDNSTPPPRRTFVRKGPQALASQGQQAARDIFAARGFSSPQMVLRWREFAGPVLGRLTAPLSLSPQGVLTISADPSVAVFLQHQTGQLIQRLNLAVGGNTVAKVKVVAGRFARTPQSKAKQPLSAAQSQWAAKNAAGVQDPGLKSALLGLAEAIAAENAKRPTAPLRPKS